MIPIPNFTPGQPLSTAGGIHVSSPTSDPPTPPPNGGYSFNPWEGYVGSTGNYELAIEYLAAFNASFPPLTVSPQGTLIIT